MKAEKLEKRRVEVLSFIENERLIVEEMAQRPRHANDQLRHEDRDLLDKVIQNINDIEARAKAEADYNRLGTLRDDAETQGAVPGLFLPCRRCPA